MSSSLKDQLLTAGLLTKEQARSGGRKKKKRPAKGRKRELSPEEQERRAVAAAHEERRKERNRELNQQREQARKAQEQADRIRQILTSRGLPKAGENDDTSRFHFQIDQRINSLQVTTDQRAKLVDGKLGIVQFDGRSHLLPTEHAQRIQAMSPKRVWIGGGDDAAEKPDENDPYAGYEVPDDLIW